MSYTLKDIIANHLTGEEGVVWIPVQIKGPGQDRTYYISRFTKELDILDEEKTVYSIMKHQDQEYKSVMFPCYAWSKIQNYAMYYYPADRWQIPMGVYVNEDIKTAIRKAKLSGIAFEDVRVSYD